MPFVFDAGVGRQLGPELLRSPYRTLDLRQSIGEQGECFTALSGGRRDNAMQAELVRNLGYPAAPAIGNLVGRGGLQIAEYNAHGCSSFRLT